MKNSKSIFNGYIIKAKTKKYIIDQIVLAANNTFKAKVLDIMEIEIENVFTEYSIDSKQEAMKWIREIALESNIKLDLITFNKVLKILHYIDSNDKRRKLIIQQCS